MTNDAVEREIEKWVYEERARKEERMDSAAVSMHAFAPEYESGVGQTEKRK